MSNANGRFDGRHRAGKVTTMVAAGVVFLAIAGCAKPTQLTVPLVDRPTDRLNLSAFAGALPMDSKIRIAVGPVTDARTEKTAIGVNAEDPVKVPIHAFGTEPAAFVQASVARCLADAGLNVVQADGSPTRVLKLELIRFWVEETRRYRTEVRAKATLAKADGATLWEGLVNGANTRFGRILSIENYQEAVSDATLQMTQGLLANPGFQNALK